MAAPGDVKAWSVDDVCNFLSGLCLENLAPRFRENAVNGSDLTDLTDEELQTELGCTHLQVKKIRKSLGIAQPATAVPPAGVYPTNASYPLVPPGAWLGSAPPVNAAAPTPYPPPPDALPPAAAPSYVTGAGGGNAKAAQAAQAADASVAQLHAQHKHATGDADAYNNAARQLQGALGVLQQTTQKLQRGQSSAPAGMLLAAARNPGLGRGRAPMAMNMVQSANLRQADADVQKACQMIEAAQQAVPDGPLPYIRPATVESGRKGIFMNMLGAGVMSQAMQMQNFKKSLAHVQQMMAEVQQALGWVQQKAQQASMAAAQLAPQLHAT